MFPSTPMTDERFDYLVEHPDEITDADRWEMRKLYCDLDDIADDYDDIEEDDDED